MGPHKICLYIVVDKKYTGCNLKTTELLDCALIGLCAVIRLNMVLFHYLTRHSKLTVDAHCSLRSQIQEIQEILSCL